MRPLQLKIRNIASLRGEHVINFEEIQNQSPIFAITGETGAGKSSILNCIGLALYGDIYKKNVQQIDVVTLGEKEGQIEFIFQAKGKYYLATWRAKVLKPNGEPYATPQTPVRNLYLLESDSFESNKVACDNKIPEILNLDFDQFCKCIILNQGEFAKFLTSSFTDRKEILEKLYPGEVLSSLSKELKSDLDSIQKRKNELETELTLLKADNFSVSDFSQKKALLEAELKISDEWLRMVEKTNEDFTTLIHYHSRYTENLKKIEVTNHEITELTRNYNFSLKTFEEVSELHQKLSREQETRLPRLHELSKLEENIESLKKQEKDLTISLNRYIEKEKISLSRIEELDQKISAWETEAKGIKGSFNFPFNKLKEFRPLLNDFFDKFNELEILQKESSGIQEKLSTFESIGKDLAAKSKEAEEKISGLSSDLPAILTTLLQRKKELQLKIEKKQLSEIKAQELKKVLSQHKKNLSDFKQSIAAAQTSKSTFLNEIGPIETTLKLHELLGAVRVCKSHIKANGLDSCPVCASPLTSNGWEEVKETLQTTNVEQLSVRKQELDRLVLKAEEEVKLFEQNVLSLTIHIAQAEEELASIMALSLIELPQLSEVEKEIDTTQKKIWEREGLLKESENLQKELTKARAQYQAVKTELTYKTSLLKGLQDELSHFSSELKELLPDSLNKEIVHQLRQESRSFDLYIEKEKAIEKVAQEKRLLLENVNHLRLETNELNKQLTKIQGNLENYRLIISEEIGDKTASQIIQELNLKVKESLEKVSSKEKELKKTELLKSELQSKANTLADLLKESELFFGQAQVKLKNVSYPKSEEENSLKLIQIINELNLSVTSPSEVLLPIKDLIETEIKFYKLNSQDLRVEFGKIDSQLKELQKKLERIEFLATEKEEVLQKFQRLERLSQVLGKDDLRTFILSLVEENLIAQTNLELQKLCQGRYEIIHHTKGQKLAPEFYILDKFRECAQRKISTLSGGETFMVSLAMALALAEMTRGQAEIDSLFIDEGFGTLDQDSLEDVLDMLHQIQTRGLMVAIISHVKPLTDSFPVNLLVKKKQDGTSQVKLQYN